MTNRKILDYAIKGMYNDIKRLEKELRIVNGTLYRINCNKVQKANMKVIQVLSYKGLETN